jgi:hypothetical protein
VWAVNSRSGATGKFGTAAVDARLRETGVDRRELLVWATILLLVNALVGGLAAARSAAIGWAWLEQSQFGALDVLAGGVALWRLTKAPRRPARARDVALVFWLCLLGGLRQQELAGLALTGLAIWLLLLDDCESKGAGAVLLAIAGHQLWSRWIFDVVSPEMVKIDGALVGEAVSLAVKGASWRNNIVNMPNGFSIAVLEGCSSFANVSASLLAWVALLKLERLSWSPRDLWVAGAAVLAQIGLNVVRLCLIAQSLPMYLYWHDGNGAQIYLAAASAMAVFIGAFGSRLAASRQ